MCINDADASTGERGVNTFAAYPSMLGLGRYYEVDVTCRGSVDQSTGYFINIKLIDRAVWKRVLPILQDACRTNPRQTPGKPLSMIVHALQEEMRGHVARVRWSLTPYYSVEMAADNLQHVLLRQQFEFAAAHRLFVPGLSDDENRRLFGKCARPNAHGHNYRVEPCVEAPLDARPEFLLADLERLVAEHVIEPFDHTHLNLDTREFAPNVGLNPSVENIAKVCFDILEPHVRHHASGARLRSVTVWETDKTSCTYPA